MVIVVGSLIFTGLSVMAIMAYAWGFATDMTKLVRYVDGFLRRCDMMQEPSWLGMSVGGALACSAVMVLMDER